MPQQYLPAARALASRRRLRGILTLIVGALAWGSAAAAADHLDDFLKGLNSLQSSFHQFTFNADRTQMMEARGTFYLQRPGRFRWEYDSPNKQVIVADGQRVYLHDLELDQVSHQSQAKALRGTPALLLAGGEPIDKHFKVKAIDSSDGRDWVELTPTDEETDILRIELGFKGNSLESLIMEDAFGQDTRLNFTATQRNPRLDPKLFEIDKRAMDEFLQFD